MMTTISKHNLVRLLMNVQSVNINNRIQKISIDEHNHEMLTIFDVDYDENGEKFEIFIDQPLYLVTEDDTMVQIEVDDMIFSIPVDDYMSILQRNDEWDDEDDEDDSTYDEYDEDDEDLSDCQEEYDQYFAK